LILFGEDFDFTAAESVVPVVDVAALAAAERAEEEAAHEAARQSAYAQGVADGMARSAAERDALTNHWTALCAHRLQAAEAEVAALADEAATSIAQLVLDILRGILPAFCARHGQAEVAALARQILPTLKTEPRIAVRVNPHDAATIMDVLDEIPEDLRGSVVVTQTDRVHGGDLQVSWQDGSVTRDTQALLGQVTDLLRQFGFVGEHA
jgi:flagellar assembly protein FliH